MDRQDRLTLLENEFHKTKEELQQIMLEIRVFLMEAQSPLRSYFDKKFNNPDDAENGG